MPFSRLSIVHDQELAAWKKWAKVTLWNVCRGCYRALLLGFLFDPLSLPLSYLYDHCLGLLLDVPDSSGRLLADMEVVNDHVELFFYAGKDFVIHGIKNYISRKV